MKYVTRISLFESGERFPVLLYEDTFQPVILSLRYVVEERRDTRQVGTIEREVRVIKWLYEWTDNRGINLEEFLRAGKLFSAGEITGFCRYLRTLRNSLVVGAVGGSAEILSPSTFNSYLNVVQAFLTWAAREFIPNNTPEEQIGIAVETARDKIKRAFSTNRMGGRTAHKIGLNEDELTELRSVIDPQSPKNPFKPACRFRNQLIILLFLLTGIRRGELLKLKINHLPQGSKQTLTVMRFPGDKSDPRRNEPQIKTLGREIPVQKPFAKMLWEYAEKHRVKGKHQFLFTSHQKGAPLNLLTVNSIFAQLVKKSLPHLKGRLHPHILRHTFNDNFVRQGKESGWSDARIEKTQKYLNGWSENSAMPEHYTRLTIQMEAAEIMEKYQMSLYEDEK
jgi:integrase